MLIGEDNLANFHQWKDYTKILDLVNVFVYPRNTILDKDQELIQNNKISLLNAPKIEISSDEIRELMKDGNDIESYLPKEVYNYITEKKLYK